MQLIICLILNNQIASVNWNNNLKLVNFKILVHPYEKPYYEECIVQGDIVCKNDNVSKKSEEIDIEDGPFIEGDIIPSHSQVLYSDINTLKWPNATVPFVFNKNIGK